MKNNWNELKDIKAPQELKERTLAAAREARKLTNEPLHAVPRHPWGMAKRLLAAVCAFAGAAVLAAQLFGTGVLVLPGGTFYAVSVLGLLLLAGLLYMLCYTIFSCTAQHGGEIRTMTLLYGGNRVPVRALHDTGCTLRDPMTGERVLVAEADALRALLPDASITPAALADPAELLLRLKTRAPALPARLLSYKCVGTQAGLLLCLRCEIQVKPGVRKRCLAAFSPTPVSDGGNYDALIGGTIG